MPFHSNSQQTRYHLEATQPPKRSPTTTETPQCRNTLADPRGATPPRPRTPWTPRAAGVGGGKRMKIAGPNARRWAKGVMWWWFLELEDSDEREQFWQF